MSYMESETILNFFESRGQGHLVYILEQNWMKKIYLRLLKINLQVYF